MAVMVADKEMDMVTDMALDKKKKSNNNWPTWSWTWLPTMKTKNMDDMVIDININMEIQFGERVGHGDWLQNFSDPNPT